MASVLVCTGGGEPAYSTNQSFVYALRSLGHDVLVCGPGYWDRNFADIPVPDKSFPETYEYEDVLSQVPGNMDLILQLEPHFFLVGKKPPEIRSAYYFTDPHRGGIMWHQMAQAGSFDRVFVGQKHYVPLFYDLPCSISYLPVAFDERRFLHADTEPEVDITFCGQTGLSVHDYSEKDHIGRYLTRAPFDMPTDIGKYEFRGQPSFDYAERGEFLFRLMQDFRVRIYEPLYDERYGQALQKGAMGFQRSLLYDVSIRAYEIMAAGRLLVMDRIPDLDDWFEDCLLYNSYYRPFYSNFDLEYRQVYKLVKYYLDHDREREAIAVRARSIVWEEHRWQNRALQLLEVVLN